DAGGRHCDAVDERSTQARLGPGLGVVVERDLRRRQQRRSLVVGGTQRHVHKNVDREDEDDRDEEHHHFAAEGRLAVTPHQYSPLACMRCCTTENPLTMIASTIASAMP